MKNLDTWPWIIIGLIAIFLLYRSTRPAPPQGQI